MLNTIPSQQRARRGFELKKSPPGELVLVARSSHKPRVTCQYCVAETPEGGSAGNPKMLHFFCPPPPHPQPPSLIDIHNIVFTSLVFGIMQDLHANQI